MHFPGLEISIEKGASAKKQLDKNLPIHVQQPKRWMDGKLKRGSPSWFLFNHGSSYSLFEKGWSSTVLFL